MMALLRAVLGLCGLGVVFLGLNVGLGGIETLGWQGDRSFVEVTDPSVFAVRDNHVRFIGGVWLGAGVVLLAGAFALRPLRTALLSVIGMIVIGALARLSTMDASLLTSADIAPSLAAELVFFPLLGVWIARATRHA